MADEGEDLESRLKGLRKKYPNDPDWILQLDAQAEERAAAQWLRTKETFLISAVAIGVVLFGIFGDPRLCASPLEFWVALSLVIFFGGKYLAGHGG